MVSYVYKRNKDGVHYLDLAKTWEKIMVAARIIAATQAKNQKDVLVSKQSEYLNIKTKLTNDITSSERVLCASLFQSLFIDYNFDPIRLFHPVNTPNVPFLSSLPTPVLTTSVENGFPVP
jgi:hypothetical protein